MSSDKTALNHSDKRGRGMRVWERMQKNLSTRWILGIFSWLYGACMIGRKLAYAGGIVPVRRLPLPVISVGNLTCGGTGKTPFVAMIAQFLIAKGKRPVILSRGYKREGGDAVISVPDNGGKSENWNYTFVGDEPCLLAQWLPNVPVIVGRERYRAGIFALEGFDVDCFILDDGFQHLSLFRAVDIVILNAQYPFGERKLLPLGRLREPLSALKRASLIVLNKVKEGQDLNPILQVIKRHNATAQVTVSSYTPAFFSPASDRDRTLPLAYIKGKSVSAFSGIADPGSFFRQIENLGGKIVKGITFDDHHRFLPKEIESIQQGAKDDRADCIVTTEKDGVRLPDGYREGIYILKMEMRLQGAEGILEDILSPILVRQGIS